MTQVEVLYWWQRPFTERQSAPPKTKIQKLERKKLCFPGGVLSQSRTNRENYMVDVRDFVWKQTLTTNELHSYIGQISFSQSTGREAVCLHRGTSTVNRGAMAGA